MDIFLLDIHLIFCNNNSSFFIIPPEVRFFFSETAVKTLACLAVYTSSAGRSGTLIFTRVKKAIFSLQKERERERNVIRSLSDLQLPSLGESVPTVASYSCSWLTGVEPDVVVFHFGHSSVSWLQHFGLNVLFWRLFNKLVRALCCSFCNMIGWLENYTNEHEYHSSVRSVYTTRYVHTKFSNKKPLCYKLMD